MTSAPHARWQQGLPALSHGTARLREVETGDAAALFSELASVEVKRFIPPAPPTAAGIEDFIARAVGGRTAGTCACFSILAAGESIPVGMIVFRAPLAGHAAWDWGFFLGARAWNTGLFGDAAALALRFAFDTIGVGELEAWTILPNGRAHGALSKLGAEPELIRQVRAPDGRFGDFIKWTIKT